MGASKHPQVSISPLLWDSPLFSWLSSLLLPPEEHRKFESILSIVHGRSRRDETAALELVKSNEVTRLCQTKFVLFTLFFSLFFFFVHIAARAVTVGDLGQAPLRLALLAVFIFLLRSKALSFDTFAALLVFTSFAGDTALVLGSMAEQDPATPPFLAYFSTSLLILPVSAIYFLRGNSSYLALATTCLVCFASFYASTGREYTVSFSFEGSSMYLTSCLLLHLFPLVYFSLYRAEAQVYQILLSRNLTTSQEKCEAKTHFISRMSHELRTPLHGLMSSVSLLRQTRITSEQDAYLSIIDSCGDLVLDIIFKILDITKIESGQFESHQADFSLFDAVGNVAKAVSSAADAKRLEFSLHFEPDPEGFDVHGDKAHLQEILSNLLENAVRNTDKGGISLSISKTPLAFHPAAAPGSGSAGAQPEATALYRFEISDTGRGIPEEHLEQIFEPFAQVSHDMKKAEGSGLGLSLVKGTVEALGGSIGVQSAVGEGSLFWFEIPCRPLSAGTFTYPLDRLPLDDPRRRFLRDVPDSLRAELARRLRETTIGIFARPTPFLSTLTRFLSAWGASFEVLPRDDSAASVCSRYRHLIVDDSLANAVQFAAQLAGQILPSEAEIEGEESISSDTDLIKRSFVLRRKPSSKLVYFASLSDFVMGSDSPALAEGPVLMLPKPIGPQTILKALGALLGFELECTPHHRLRGGPPSESESPHTSDREAGGESSGQESEEDTRLMLRTKALSSSALEAESSEEGDEELDVLVVEDNPVTQIVMRKQLEKLRVRFRITSSGEEGTRIYRRNKGGIPLVFMDVEVDGPINGLEATTRIRGLERSRRRRKRSQEQSKSAQAHTPAPERDDLPFSSVPEERSFIAIMTGRALETDKQEAYSAGCDAFLSKPVRLETIRELVITKTRLAHQGPLKAEL